MPDSQHYCTLLDRSYATRGLTLYSSLEAHSSSSFTLWVLCMDDDVYGLLDKLNLCHVRLVPLVELEAYDPALLATKPSRTIAEYCWTCKPSWLRFLLERFPQIALITYLDSDLFFFADPKPIFDEFGSRSILIVPHLFPEFLRHLEVAGVYNAGLMMFRNDQEGSKCLDYWRTQCLEWCYQRTEDGRSGDQKYLDQWPLLYSGVHVLHNKGAVVGPWNHMTYRIEAATEGCKVDGEPLILFHFHALRLVNSWFAYPPDIYGPVSRIALRLIYRPYLATMRKAVCIVRDTAPGIPTGAPGIGSPRRGRYSPGFVASCWLRGKLAQAF